MELSEWRKWWKRTGESELRALLMATWDPTRIARDYEPQFRAAESLLGLVWETAPRVPENETQIVIMNVLGRCMSTYRALLHLLQGGHSEQGWMLNRSMFEDLVFGYWVALPANREKAASLVGAHADETVERIEIFLSGSGRAAPRRWLRPATRSGTERGGRRWSRGSTRWSSRSNQRPGACTK